MKLKSVFIFFFFILSSVSQLEAQISITAPSIVFSENFTSLATSATATMPSGWRASNAANSTSYATGITATTASGGTTGVGAMSSGSAGGIYNFSLGATATGIDRALGILSSGAYAASRSLFVQMVNNTGNPITVLNISYDIEKYKSGTSAFNINFFHGPDGSTWTSASSGDQAYAANAVNTAVSPPTFISKNFAITGLNIAAGASYYLMWTYSAVAASTNGQGLGIDNFTVSAINCSPIATQSSAAVLSAADANQVTLDWTAGTGTGGSIVVAKAGSAVNSNPVSAVMYAANPLFGGGTQIGTGNYVVYQGMGTNVTVTNLNPESNYYFAIYTLDAGTPCYLATSPATANDYTLSSPATADPNSFAVTTSSCSDIILNWNAATFAGAGATSTGYVILMRSDGSNPTTSGVLSKTAPGSLTLPAGTTLAATVTNGATTTATINGLASGVTYNFMIIPHSYDGTNNGTYNYYLSGSSPVTTGSTSNTATSTYFYRSRASGNWSVAINWEASVTGAGGWVTACTAPTNTASGITILSGHTITLDANATAPDVTVNNGGTLQANSTSFVTLTMNGNLQNDGTFQMVNGAFGANVIFNKNGNQTVTGTGATTNFYSVGLNMGASRSNYLDISSTNFSGVSPILWTNPKTSIGTNTLQNGTLKLSGSYTWTGTFFKTGSAFGIPANAGIWINNTNVTVSGSADSYDVSGMLKVSAGVLNSGTAVGNAIRLLNGSTMIVTGGTVNAAGRIQGYNSSATAQTTTYNQSGGTVVVSALGANTSGSMPEFAFGASDSVIFSGGTLVVRNQATSVDDIFNYATTVVTGGIIQIADASTTVGSVTAAGFQVESPSFVPSIVVYHPAGVVTALLPKLVMAEAFNVIGDITIQSGASLTNRWAASALYYDISLTGNWINNGTFTHNNQKTVTFNGSSAQQMSGTTNTTFNHLKINNSSGGVTLNSPETVRGTLTLTNNNIFTTATNVLALTSTASSTSGSASSFVDGPMSKDGTTGFVFPVGKGSKWARAAISAPTSSTTFTTEYFNSSYIDVTNVNAPLTDVSVKEYWMLNRTTGSGDAFITLYWEDANFSGIDDCPDLTIARYNGASWDERPGTTVGGSVCSGTGAGSILSNAAITAFSPFTFASKSGTLNPLPVELVSFTANYTTENTVALKWTTESELNNDYFTVERSEDASHFIPLMNVDGAGNSSQMLNYTSADMFPLNGTSYYRLKQTDFNGTYKYSAIVSVNALMNDFSIVNVYNSAENGTLEVTMNCDKNCMLNVELYDMRGRRIYSSVENTAGTHSKIDIPTDGMSEGIYLLKIFNGEELISKKIKL